MYNMDINNMNNMKSRIFTNVMGYIKPNPNGQLYSNGIDI